MELLQKAVIAMAAPATIWAIVKSLEETASQTARVTLATWLKSSKFSDDHTSPLQAFLLNIFHEFFSRNPITWKFARRVLICSIAAVTLFWLVSISVLLVYFGQADGPLKNESLFMLLVPLSATVAGVLISFPCDYLSVIKSLALIKLAEAENKFQFYFVVDFSVSLMMGIAWFLFIAFILVTFGEYLKNFEVLWAFEGKAYLEVTTVLSVLSVAVTSLAPTLMLLVLTAAGYVARTAFRLTKPFDFLRRRVLHLDEKPFLSLGLLLAIPGYLFVLLILLAVG